MIDPVRVYVDARRRCEASFRALHRMHDTVAMVSDTLKRDPEAFGFSGTARSLPAGVTELVNGSDWPTVSDLQETLAQCHRFYAELQNAWNNVPHEDRSALQPPGNPWRPVPETLRRLT